LFVVGGLVSSQQQQQQMCSLLAAGVAVCLRQLSTAAAQLMGVIGRSSLG
jgi:hypothetical protein